MESIQSNDKVLYRVKQESKMADFKADWWTTEETIQAVEKKAYRNGKIMGAFTFFSAEVFIIIFGMLFYLATNYG